jgi:DNA-binding protein HU-beta
MANSVSKTQLVEAVAEKQGLNKKDVKAVVDGLFEHITDHLKRGDKVQITGFGTFEVRERQARNTCEQEPCLQSRQELKGQRQGLRLS